MDNYNYSEFERLSYNRSSILSIYVYRMDERYSISREIAAQKLYQYAESNGIQKNLGTPYGGALSDWYTNNKGPLWACKSALLMLIEDGWAPSMNSQFAVFAYLFIRIHSGNLTDLIDRLPHNVDKITASGWLCAALESRARFKEKSAMERKSRVQKKSTGNAE